MKKTVTLNRPNSSEMFLIYKLENRLILAFGDTNGSTMNLEIKSYEEWKAVRKEVDSMAAELWDAKIEEK